MKDMTVQELIAHLQTMPPEAICCVKVSTNVGTEEMPDEDDLRAHNIVGPPHRYAAAFFGTPVSVCMIPIWDNMQTVTTQSGAPEFKTADTGTADTGTDDML